MLQRFAVLIVVLKSYNESNDARDASIESSGAKRSGTERDHFSKVKWTSAIVEVLLASRLELSK
jgi:hypothetical protein